MRQATEIMFLLQRVWLKKIQITYHHHLFHIPSHNNLPPQKAGSDENYPEGRRGKCETSYRHHKESLILYVPMHNHSAKSFYYMQDGWIYILLLDPGVFVLLDHFLRHTHHI